jgi:hypothetical protein
MTFVTLIPVKVLKKRTPVIYNSTSYGLCKKYNPVIKPFLMENLRKVKRLAGNSKRLKRVSESAVFQDYLKTKKIENPFADSEAMDYINNGDIEGLKKKGYYKLLSDKDFMEFIHGEKYYNRSNEEPLVE